MATEATPETLTSRTVSGDLMFNSPSGNIECHGYGDSGRGASAVAECFIREFSFTPPPEPEECKRDGDYSGNVVVVTSEEGSRWGCPTGVISDRYAPRLAYGSTLDFGGVACTSTTDGMKCETDSGAGFFVSRTNTYTY